MTKMVPRRSGEVFLSKTKRVSWDSGVACLMRWRVYVSGIMRSTGSVNEELRRMSNEREDVM